MRREDTKLAEFGNEAIMTKKERAQFIREWIEVTAVLRIYKKKFKTLRGRKNEK